MELRSLWITRDFGNFDIEQSLKEEAFEKT